MIRDVDSESDDEKNLLKLTFVIKEGEQYTYGGSTTINQGTVIADVTVLAGTLGADAADADTLDALRLPALDWMKLGAGASASAVLAGGADTLWRLRPRLYCAVADADAARALAERLRDFGYRCWRHDTAWFVRDNFNCRATDVWDGALAHALVALPEEYGEAPADLAEIL